MTKTIFKGVHATSITRAKAIQDKGVKGSKNGRAGAGFYLWSYITDPTRAVELSEDWHRDCYNRGVFSRCAERDLALLFFEIELEPIEVVNLNSTAHHEAIAAKVGRVGDKSTLSKAWDDHIKGISENRQRTAGRRLKMVEVQLPVPSSTKERWAGGGKGQVNLTVGGDSYIVLPNALDDLKLVETRI